MSYNTLSEESNYLQNNFTISRQPKQNFHYRYVTELKNSHGYLTGQQRIDHYHPPPNSTSNDVYPSVKLLLPKDGHLDDFQNKRDFFVLCTIHNNDNKCLSPHLLLAKGETRVNYTFIFEKMDDNCANVLERNWELKEYVIVRLKTEEFRKSLETKANEYKKLQLPLEHRTLQDDLDLSDERSVKNSGNLNVCLGFTIFEKDFYNNTYRLYKETIFSNNIYHGDDIKIHHLCNTKGSILGGTKITVLIKLNSNFPLNVLITRINEKTKETDWKKEISIKNEDIFGKHAITFLLPAYEGPPCADDEIEVNIEVVVAGTTYKSQNVKFYYLNNSEDNRPRKRARNGGLKAEMTESANEVSSTSSISSSSTTDNNTTLEIPSITNYEPNLNLDINEMLSLLGTNSLSADLDVMQPNFYYDNNTDFEYISRDRIAVHSAEIPKSGDTPSERTLPNCFNKRIDASSNLLLLNHARQVDPITKIKNKIDRILKMPKEAKDIDIMGLENENGNTIFHEALSTSEAFIYLYKATKNSPHQQLVLKARNKHRENLLHFASKNNKAMCIRPLIGMGCCINEQDNSGRTPLHIAMEYDYTECILKIQELLKDHSKYPPEVKDCFIKMFKVYNHAGYTVLHSAVSENRMELVEIMLEFCRKYKINVLDYEVLGSGDSIVHLVVKHNLIDMVHLIRKYIPHYLTIENYPGKSVLDLADTPKDMLIALRA